jgi:hypothetical protein
MAFGKKKDEQSDPVNLFEEEEAASAADAAPDDPDGTATLSEQAPDAQPEATAAAGSPAADPLAGGADALLSLFQEDEAGGEDRGALLDIAGDVEMSDLLDDLRTLAVAMRIDLSTIRG